VDVKIGVTDSGRELTVSSAATPEEIESQVAASLADPAGLLTLVDDKGRKLIVPSARIAYVEIAPSDGQRRVGFGVQG
jgi:hypothetical protein